MTAIPNRGFWRPTQKTYTGAQLASAVQAGRGAMTHEITAANYPNASLRLFYKHAGVANQSPSGTGSSARDASATLFTSDDVEALGSPAGAWIAQHSGSPMAASAGNGDSGAWFMDLGNAAYRAASCTEIVRFLDDAVARGETVNGVYFDNASGSATFGMAPHIPDGYTQGTWRDAVIQFYAEVADALKTAGYYCAANMIDYYDTGLGEVAGDYNDGSTIYRYWQQVHDYIVANNTHTDALDGFFFEFFAQLDDGTKRYVGTNASYKQWDNFQGLVAHAQTTLNRDFHATAVENATFPDAGFELASALLDLDPSRDSTLWIWNTSSSSATMTNTDLTADVGAPLGAKSAIGSGWKREFALSTVYVNPTASPIVMDGHTVAATDYVFAAAPVGGVALHATSESVVTGHVAAIADIGTQTDVWITADVYIPSSYTLPSGDDSGYLIDTFQTTPFTFSGFGGLFIENESGTLKWWQNILSESVGFADVTFDQWVTVEAHLVKAAGTLTIRVLFDGAQVYLDSDPGVTNVDIDHVLFGSAFSHDGDDFYFRNIMVGSTQGASDLFDGTLTTTIVPPFESTTIQADTTLTLDSDPSPDAGPLVGRVLIAFEDVPLEPNPAWTRIDDVDNFVAGIDIHRGRQTETEQTDTSTATVYLNDTDGLFDPANTGSPYFGLIDGKQIVLQLWNPVTAEWVQQWRGFIDDYGYDFNPAINAAGEPLVANVAIECVDLFEYLAGVEMIPGLFGQTPPAGSEGVVFYEDGDVQTRIENLLADAFNQAYTPPLDGSAAEFSVVFSGNVDVRETKYDAGDSILIALRDACDAEFPGIANMYTDKRGRFVFHGRKARFDPDTVALDGDWTFTRWKAGDGAAITLDADRAQIRPPLAWARPRSRIVNAAMCSPRVDTTAGPGHFTEANIADQIVVDNDSRDAYGYRSWSATDLITQEGTTTGYSAKDECRLFAQWKVANYKDPRSIVEALTFKAIHPDDPRAEATWALICGQDISDIVDLEHGYPGGAGVSEEFYIEGSDMTIRPLNPTHDMVELTLNVSPASYYDDNVFVVS